MLHFARFIRGIYMTGTGKSAFSIIDLNEGGAGDRPSPWEGWKLSPLPHGLQIEAPNGVYAIVPYALVETMTGVNKKAPTK